MGSYRNVLFSLKADAEIAFQNLLVDACIIALLTIRCCEENKLDKTTNRFTRQFKEWRRNLAHHQHPVFFNRSNLFPDLREDIIHVRIFGKEQCRCSGDLISFHEFFPFI